MEVIVECASDGAFYKGISAVSSIDLDAGDFATCGLDEQSLPMNRLPGPRSTGCVRTRPISSVNHYQTMFSVGEQLSTL